MHTSRFLRARRERHALLSGAVITYQTPRCDVFVHCGRNSNNNYSHSIVVWCNDVNRTAMMQFGVVGVCIIVNMVVIVY